MKEKQEKGCKGPQLLEELGLLENDAETHISLKKKETSQMSNMGQ